MSTKLEITAIAVRESAAGSIDFTAQKNVKGTIKGIPTQKTFKGKEYMAVETVPSINAKGSGSYCQNASDMLAILWKSGMVKVVRKNEEGEQETVPAAGLDFGITVSDGKVVKFEIVKVTDKVVELHSDATGKVTAVAKAAPTATE